MMLLKFICVLVLLSIGLSTTLRNHAETVQNTEKSINKP